MAGIPPACRIATCFQPIFSVHSSALAGFEALARPVTAAGVPIATGDFFAARSTAELARIDRECRRAHVSRFAALDEGRGMLYLNVHPRALLADASDDLRAELGLHGLEPSRVCIEILEDDSGDEGLLAEAVAFCRQTGIRVAMDDFGIARSNFDRVAALSPDYVKIDRSILNETMGCTKAARLLPSAIRVLHDAGAQVVVEGIEEAPEALCAIEAGADFVQGFYFGIPRSALVVDPMATDFICRLKRLRHACGSEAPDCGVSNAVTCLARLLDGGPPALGTAD
jgi:EAL domain-containing protein (putative c-di-GMP-specific phosphodiesterase class I)